MSRSIAAALYPVGPFFCRCSTVAPNALHAQLDQMCGNSPRYLSAIDRKSNMAILFGSTTWQPRLWRSDSGRRALRRPT